MLKILLADNQAIFRAGIAKVLAVEDDLRVVAQAQSVEQMMMALDKFRASVMIFSASFLPDLSTVVQAATRFKTGLIVVAENGENAAKYLNAGVRGVVYRNVSGDMLVECVQSLARGTFHAELSPRPALPRATISSALASRSAYPERVAHRGTHRPRLQEQGNRSSAWHYRAGDQELPSQRLRQDRRFGPARTGALYHPSPHPGGSRRGHHRRQVLQ